MRLPFGRRAADRVARAVADADALAAEARPGLIDEVSGAAGVRAEEAALDAGVAAADDVDRRRVDEAVDDEAAHEAVAAAQPEAGAVGAGADQLDHEHGVGALGQRVRRAARLRVAVDDDRVGECGQDRDGDD
jgi:hypothetical protein